MQLNTPTGRTDLDALLLLPASISETGDELVDRCHCRSSVALQTAMRYACAVQINLASQEHGRKKGRLQVRGQL